ncbi:hypothetical protein GSI_05013 [Ganoderma sinense ZZ0214-1]|uniref:F-box domain-containing protein n=1 Tax=Ganoderma sinense ZZ0214-1 TaxID=1077348 RepID=A0A2G8SGI4_9APHY|nr:hypothetical protein GSI_05013 [Ganoderma sinense ZZ0214-1]
MMFDSNPMVHPELSEKWRLPFDVVSVIMATPEPPLISALMKTCHTLYMEGPKHLLRDGVQLDSANRIILFARFMLTAKDPSRFSHFRKLDLRPRFPLDFPYAQKLLIDLLSHPSLALDTMILDNMTGRLDRGLDSVCGMLGTIQTLRHLVVLRVGEVSASLIQSLPSKLESLIMGVDANAGSRLDVMSVLRPFSDTLQTLLIKCTPSLPPTFSLTGTSSYFPFVRTFGIVVYDPVLELLANPAFARAFPSVTHLQLIPADPPTVPYRSPPLPQSRNTGTLPTPSSLMECSGALHHVYASALDCSLSTLRLWQHVLVRDLDLLRTVLGDTRPQHLCFGTQVDDVRQVLSILDALENHTPPRIDMTVLIPPSGSSWLSRLLKGPRDMVRTPPFLVVSLPLSNGSAATAGQPFLPPILFAASSNWLG